MDNNLNISIKRYLGDDKYISDTIELFVKTIISPWGSGDFRWEGDYNGEKIIVNLPRGCSEEHAEIIKPSDLNINLQIDHELKRVLKRLN